MTTQLLYSNLPEQEDTVEITVHGSWYKQAWFDTIKAQTSDEMVLIKELFDNNIQ